MGVTTHKLFLRGSRISRRQLSIAWGAALYAMPIVATATHLVPMPTLCET